MALRSDFKGSGLILHHSSLPFVYIVVSELLAKEMRPKISRKRKEF